MECDLDIHHPTSLPQPHAQRRSSAPTFIQPSGVRPPSPPAFKARSTKKTESDPDMYHRSSSHRSHAQRRYAAPPSVQLPVVGSPSPPVFETQSTKKMEGVHHRPRSPDLWKALADARPRKLGPAGTPVPYPRDLRSSSPTGLAGESDEDLWSDADESEVADPSDGKDGDDDEGLISSRMMSLSLDRSGRTGSESGHSSGDGVRASRLHRLSAPMPVPNLTKRSHGRNARPEFTKRCNLPKDAKMYNCTVKGCKVRCSREEFVKQHVQLMHTNKKRE